MNDKTKIFLSGGGTLGSVIPLIAVYQNLIKKNYNNNNFLWVGTKEGPEKKLVTNYNIKFTSINYGKFRRYFSLQNFTDIFYIIIGFIESINLLIKHKPEIVISAGSFVSVPLVWAARFFGKKIIIHQLDIKPGLANKIMTPAADIVTVTFEKSQKEFSKTKTIWTGNPVRQELENIDKYKDQAYEYFQLTKKKPVLLIKGGGTGALGLNKIIRDNLDGLLNLTQIIHITGVGKAIDLPTNREGYRMYEFLKDELLFAYAIADLVISRAGLSTLTELSYLKKPTIVVPIPDSHQEDNVKYFQEQNAVIYLEQNKKTSEFLLNNINELINNKDRRETLANNFKKAMKSEANNNFLVAIKKIIN